jgi:hypothetical protein
MLCENEKRERTHIKKKSDEEQKQEVPRGGHAERGQERSRERERGQEREVKRERSRERERETKQRHRHTNTRNIEK